MAIVDAKEPCTRLRDARVRCLGCAEPEADMGQPERSRQHRRRGSAPQCPNSICNVCRLDFQVTYDLFSECNFLNLSDILADLAQRIKKARRWARLCTSWWIVNLNLSFTQELIANLRPFRR